MKTNYQDPGSTEILSTQISGLQDALGKIEDAVGMQTTAATGISLTEVYISDTDRYRIYQAPVGKRNWTASPAPVIKKNGSVISTGFIIDYSGGAIILSPAALGTDAFTADVTYMTNTINNPTQKITIDASVGSIPSTVVASSQLSDVRVQGNSRNNLVKSSGMNVDTNIDGKVDDFSSSNSIGATFALNDNAQKISIVNSATNNAFARVMQGNLGDAVVIPCTSSEVMSARVECKFTKTAGSPFAYFQLAFRDTAGNTVAGGGFVTSNITTSTSGYTELKIENKTAPANTAYAEILCILQTSPTASTTPETADVWFKNAMLEKASAVGNYISTGVKSTLPVRFSSAKNIFGGVKAADRIVSVVNNATYAYKATVDGRNCIAILGNAATSGKIYYDKFEPNTQYTLQVWAKRASAASPGASLSVKYTDGTFIVFAPSNDVWTKITVTTAAGKTIANICSIWDSSHLCYYDYDTMQVEKGTTATDVDMGRTEAYSNATLTSVGSGSTIAKDEYNADGTLTKRNSDDYAFQPNQITQLLSLTNVDLLLCPLKTLKPDYIGANSDITVTKGTVRVKDKLEISSNAKDNASSVGMYYVVAGDVWFIVQKGLYPTLANAQANFPVQMLNCQLATSITEQIGDPQSLMIGPNYTVIIEPFIKDTEFYNDKITVPLAIKGIDFLWLVDDSTDTKTAVATTNAVISSDGLSFTITGAKTGEKYEYGAYLTDGSSTLPTVDITADISISTVAIQNSKDISTMRGEINDIKKAVDSPVMSNTVSLGFGNKLINYSGKSPVFPKIEFSGMDYVNLLGADGNCENASKWTDILSSHLLDTNNKVFGKNSVKVTATGASGEHMIDASANIPLLNSSAYYLLTGYAKPVTGNASIRCIVLDSAASVLSVVAITTATDTAKFTRVALKFQAPAGAARFTTRLQVLNAAGGNVFTPAGEAAYFDGVMLNEISAADYALTTDQLMAKYPYVDSYGCLQNPYFELRRDNLVLNGNGEEGVAHWFNTGISVNAAVSLAVENGYFRFDDNSASAYGMAQRIRVAPNKAYTLKFTYKKGTSNAGIIVNEFDATGAVSHAYTVNDSTASTTDVTVSRTFTTAAATAEVWIYIMGSTTAADTGTSYYKEFMLVEGTVAPAAYKSCQLERFVIEGKFTKDDTVTIEGGRVQGYTYWKHRILYGKDFDWKFNSDYTGYKVVGTAGLKGALDASTLNAGIKYDGSIIKSDTWGNMTAAANRLCLDNGGNLSVSAADTDTGWTETINPNDDEVKAFMNGWKATANNGTRYTSWVSVVDGTTAPGNQLIDFVKQNVAQFYEGYQLHYKLAVPEEISDATGGVHGEVWALGTGDNYINIDSGMVLGEITTPVNSGGSWYEVNIVWGNYLSPLQFKAEDIFTVYANSAYDYGWARTQDDLAYGKTRVQLWTTNYDPLTVFTVDYQMLKTMHAQNFASLTVEYTNSIIESLESAAKAIENRQMADAALDTLVDMAMYEKIIYDAPAGYFKTGANSLYLYAIQPLAVPKRTVPTVTLKDVAVVTGQNIGLNVANLFTIAVAPRTYQLYVYALTTDATVISNIINYGAKITLTAFIDCRERV